MVRVSSAGFLTVVALVFIGVFVTVMTALSSYIVVQTTVQRAKEEREIALQIAEAGLDYYRWFLAHNPGNITDGTGMPGPYVHPYNDPEGGTIGQFSLDINGNLKCGAVTAIDIRSTGSTLAKPTLTRTVRGRYARPSVAEFSYVLNSHVWAGADRQIYGPYHSNGGIRMDGTNHSQVTSSIPNNPPGWLCTASYGCSPSQNKPGIFGAGSGSALWGFPVPQVDFAGITIDLVNMKTRAQSNGVYIGSASPAGIGYHIILRNDRTYDLYRVSSHKWVWGLHADDMEWHHDNQIINNQFFLGNFPIPADCGVIFVEDDLWIEGAVKGKITVASADTINVSVDTTVILSNNITYTVADGTDGLTLVAEDNILIPLISPDNMVLNGIFIAQKGYFGRNAYFTSGTHQIPAIYDPYAMQNSLTVFGTIVSNERTGTKWSCSGTFCSGYNTRMDSYDRKLASDPPPFTPYSSQEYGFVEWKEEE